MEKLSEFAVFCKKLRIDNNQILKDMAGLLNVSSSYLSAVENGKRKIPDEWYDRISNLYLHLISLKFRTIDLSNPNSYYIISVTPMFCFGKTTGILNDETVGSIGFAPEEGGNSRCVIRLLPSTLVERPLKWRF